jgi:predicted ester cyclase
MGDLFMNQPAPSTTEPAPDTCDPRSVGIRSVRLMADGSFEDIARVTHPRCVNREAVDEPPEASAPGPDGIWATAQWLRSAFSELAFEVHDVVAEGEVVVVRCTMSGRHTGPMVLHRDGAVQVAMPPTGRRFATLQSHWFRLEYGQVIEHWADRDDLGTAEQLGWVPPSPRFLVRQALATRRARRAARTRTPARPGSA